MNATFVQVDEAELSRFRADPFSVEMLFQEGDSVIPPAFLALHKTMQDRVRAAGPQMMAQALSRLDPRLRQQIEQSLGRTSAALAGGAGGDQLLKLMQERGPRGKAATAARTILSLDKAWHGVHYVLCGEVEAGAALLSQPVLGGVAIGDDDEGFSGYGPARYFTAAKVAELAHALSRPELEAEAAARFDPERMSELQIYPGWRSSDAEWVLDNFHRLRDFYSGAGAQHRAIVTCLV
ncbi:MAG TPA: YfbM family protein [Bryobacteraceae bacterium]|nr:YfbM family protein [Bryobacteraceae bacterium]